MATVNEWDEKTFTEATASGVALVDFFATWCGPCKMMMSVLEQAVAEFDDAQVKVGKVNIDSCRELAVKYNIRTIPTFVAFKDGKIFDTIIGVQSRKALSNLIVQALK